MAGKWLRVIVLLSVCAAGASTLWAADEVRKMGDNLVEVTVLGAGMDKKAAVDEAMRKAVERGAGTFIHSQSQVSDFVLVQDTVLAKSAGFIQSHEILSQKEVEDGTWEVRLKAVVSIQGVEDMWGTVKTLLQRMGRPKIMVFISEKIDGQVQEDSTVQTRVENLLLKSGFLLVNRKQISAIQAKELEAAVAEDNPAKLQAVAKDFGAQLFISGSTTAAKGDSRETYGVTMHRYTADGDIKCYRSDTGQLLASQNATSYMPDKDSARNAAKRAIASLGDKLAPAVQMDILNFWSEVLQGRGELVLEVQGVSFKDYAQLKKQLATIDGVKDVNTQFSNSIAKCSIQSDVSAETLAERIMENVEGIEITDVSQNVIKAQMGR